MVDFGDLLRKGKRRQEIKSHKAKWGKCESCGQRSKLYPYDDKQKSIWRLCERCIEGLVSVKGNEP